MRVVVANKYTYETDLPVEVGSKVRLPGRAPGTTFDGEVTALESTYDGECKKILGVIVEYVAIRDPEDDSIARIVHGEEIIHRGPADGCKQWLRSYDPLGKLIWK